MDTTAIAELNRQFGIHGIASIVAGRGGLAKIAVTAGEASGEVYLHGAHVISWQPTGVKEVLFVSQKSHWESDRAIRGGVPVCFPWFADNSPILKAPMHGFLRTAQWKLESIRQLGNKISVELWTTSDAGTKPWWPADFEANYRVTFGAELTLELQIANTGAMPFNFEEALHTYFRIGQIEKIRIEGLDATDYLDKTDSKRRKTQRGPLTIAAETDSVYLNTDQTVELVDDSLSRRIRVAKENSLSTVVWNPWIEKAKAMSDFDDSEWQQMVCIETCNVGNCSIKLEPGQQHTMRAVYSVVD